MVDVQLLSSWLDHAKNLGPVYSLLAETHYDPLMNVEMEFLRQAQALEIFHRRLHGDVNFGKYELQQLKNAVEMSLPGEFRKEVKDELLGKLDYINEYSFARRLRALLDGLIERLRNNIMGESLDTFVRKVVHTRNHLVHFGERSKYILDGFEAFSDMNRRLRALLLIQLCGLMGVRDDIAVEHILGVLRLRDTGQ